MWRSRSSHSGVRLPPLWPRGTPRTLRPPLMLLRAQDTELLRDCVLSAVCAAWATWARPAAAPGDR